MSTLEVEGLHINKNDSISQEKELEVIEPRVGMIFYSLVEVENFYNGYAKKVGFGIRRNQSKLDKDGQIIFKRFVCCKEGFKRNNVNNDKIRKRQDSKEGCMAQVAVKLVEKNKWEVRKFIKEHSHHLTSPSKIQFLRSHRKVSTVHKSLVDEFSKINLPTNKLISILETQSDDYANIRCTEVYKLCVEVENEAIKSDEARLVVLEGLMKLRDAAKEINSNIDLKKTQESTPLPCVEIVNPNIANSKRSGKRIKESKEITMERAAKGGRLCANCKQRGDHDKRNCPRLKQINESGSQIEEQSSNAY